jgi:hypothetical protein
MIAAIPLRHCALRATTGCLRRNPPSLLRTARRNSTPSNPSPGSAAHCAQKTDPIAGDTPRDSSNGYALPVTSALFWGMRREAWTCSQCGRSGACDICEACAEHCCVKTPNDLAAHRRFDYVNLGPPKHLSSKALFGSSRRRPRSDGSVAPLRRTPQRPRALGPAAGGGGCRRGLTRPAMAATVVCDHPEALLREEEHLAIPSVRAQRPAVTTGPLAHRNH